MSNWAGVAISIGLYIVSQSPVHWRYRNHALDADQPPNWNLDHFVLTDQQVQSVTQSILYVIQEGGGGGGGGGGGEWGKEEDKK